MEGWVQRRPRKTEDLAHITVKEEITLIGAVRAFFGPMILKAIIITGLFVIAANVYDHFINKPGTWQEKAPPRRATPQSPGIEKVPS